MGAGAHVRACLEEKQLHINALELEARLLGLRYFIKEEKIHIKVFSDSTTAIGCINKTGTSHSDICHHFTKLIWEWAEKKGIHITAAHIPGDKNIEADRESRELSVDLEWMLYLKSLSKALVLLNYTPKVDLFASNVSHPFHTYYSYKEDPEASDVDSFSADWSSLRFYALPPFSIVLKVLKKIKPTMQKVSWLYHFGQTNHGFLLY